MLQPARLNGFQSLVPAIFTSYLARGTPARAKLCETSPQPELGPEPNPNPGRKPYPDPGPDP